MDGTTYHDKFLLYLESLRKFNDDERNILVAFAENDLPLFIQNNGFPDFTDIYSNLNIDFWNGIVTDGLPTFTDDEREYAHSVMESIRFIKGFIRFDTSADYKKLFAKKIQKENKKKAQQTQPNAVAAHVDISLPEEPDRPRREGEPTQVCVTHYERNPEDRKKVLERDNYECQVCHMKFIETYGEIGKDFIEVHHLYPVCNMDEDYHFDPLDPEKGLVCLCSNCHSMIHRGGHYEMIDGERKMVPMSLKDLQALYNTNNNNK